MKVEIYSREAMERRLQEGKLYDTAVICFYDPPSSRTPADYAPINYDKKCSAEYSIAIHDIDPEVLSEYGLTMETYGSVNKKKKEISDFSQRGDWVDIYARGEEITIKTLSGDKRESEGTSYSAALVTARAARLLQKNKNLTPQELREKLVKKAKQLDSGILALN